MELCFHSSDHNRFLLNCYLEKHRPDFLLLNEPNKKSNKDIIMLHEEYKLIDNGPFTGLIYNSKYCVHKILNNLHDNYTLICRVTLADKDKQLIIVVVYSSSYRY